MNYQQLVKELEKAVVKPVYCLAGEDSYSKDLIIKKLKDIIKPGDFNFFESYSDKTSAAEVISLSRTAPVFSDKRLIIIRKAEKFSNEDKKMLCDYLENPLHTTCLVLNFDERKFNKWEQISKACEKVGEKVIFYEVKNSIAQQWVMERISKEGVKIPAGAAKLMVETSGTDLNVLEQEVSKLLVFHSKAKEFISEDDVLKSLGFSKEENPFDISKLILSRETKKAMLLVDKLIESGEESLFILSIISSCVIKILKVKKLLLAGAPRERIFSEAGLNSYYDRDFIQQTERFFDENNLAGALNKALEAEWALKTSKVNAATVLKSVLLRLIPKAS